MKKLIITTALLVCSLFGIAQENGQHLKFVGVPINGTISEFHSKFIGKGFQQDVALSRSLPVGCRAYKGTFVGEKADIYIYYDASDKKVYRAKSVITTTDDDIAQNKYNDIKGMLQIKYSLDKQEEGTYEGNPSFSITVKNASGEMIGTISLYMTSYGSYDKSYAVHIDYEDFINSLNHLSNKMEDL